MAELPPELLRNFLGHLKKDTQSLKAVSLVCQSWLTTSRELLFYHYTFPPTTRSPPLVLNKTDCPQSVLTFVRCLTLDGSRTVEFAPASEIVTRAGLLGIFSNLTELRISRIAFPNPSSLVQLGFSCPNLTALFVEDVRYRSVGVPKGTENSTLPFPIHLSQLQIRGANVRATLIELFAPSTATAKVSSRRITRLAISHIKQEDMPALKLFGQCSAQYLEDFAIAYDISDPHLTLWSTTNGEHPDCHGLPNLRTFYIGGFIIGNKPWNPMSGVGPEILRASGMPRLETVVFELAIQKVGQMDHVQGGAVNWHVVDDALSNKAKFEHLRDVIFHATGSADIEGLTSLLVARLPLVHGLGLLSIRKSQEYLYPL